MVQLEVVQTAGCCEALALEIASLQELRPHKRTVRRDSKEEQRSKRTAVRSEKAWRTTWLGQVANENRSEPFESHIMTPYI